MSKIRQIYGHVPHKIVTSNLVGVTTMSTIRPDLKLFEIEADRWTLTTNLQTKLD